MKVSIIIPTINRYEDLKNTVKDVLNQDFDSYEVLIIDQTESGDATIINELSSNSKINYIRSDVKSASAARNIGINESKGEVLIFIDDDVIIEDNNYIHYHYRHYNDKSVTGVVGCPLEQSLNQKPRYYKHWMSYRNREVAWLYFPSNYGCNSTTMVGRSNNLSVRKNLAADVGGMDENYEKGAHREEGDFCLRVSRKYGSFLFDPQARLIHIGNRTGGIRSWNDSDYIKAKHNMVGAIYFDLKMAPLRFKHEYMFATLRYFILNKTILSRPGLYYPVIARCFSALKKAYQLYRSGPKYLNTNNKKIENE